MNEYLIIAFWIIAAFTLCMLVMKVWGDGIYMLVKNWRVVTAVAMVLVFVSLISLKHDNLQYEMASYVYSAKTPDDVKIASTIQQCKGFVQAKLEGQETQDYRTISAGIINISNISYWEICANTFGMNYWKHDISINGNNGGHLLCDAYTHATYRSSKVNAWCDTVFASPRTEDQKV